MDLLEFRVLKNYTTTKYTAEQNMLLPFTNIIIDK